MIFVRAYLRASTKEQDAERARGALAAFVKEQGVKVASWYVENESGAKLDRPELFRLLEDSHEGDVLLLEQVDRLSRLNTADWNKLRTMLKAKGVRVVALDLPMSYGALDPDRQGDTFQGRMLEAITDMMLDMLAAIARKDYEDRKRRAKEGIAARQTRDADRPAEERGFRGRRIDTEQHAKILELIDKKLSWSKIQDMLGVGRATIARAVKLAKANDGD
jgi:DNA invertase Pin-like site-specific DNA recombinase